MKELTCIVCPNGCHLTVDENLSVTGNRCPRGIDYAVSEMTHPVRMVTSTVKVLGGECRTSVRTSVPVSKELIPEVMEVIRRLCVTAPVKRGQILASNVCGTHADIVVTRAVTK